MVVRAVLKAMQPIALSRDTLCDLVSKALARCCVIVQHSLLFVQQSYIVARQNTSSSGCIAARFLSGANNRASIARSHEQCFGTISATQKQKLQVLQAWLSPNPI